MALFILTDLLTLYVLSVSPLNQYDVPRAFPVLQFSDNEEDQDLNTRDAIKVPATPARPLVNSPTPEALQMSIAQIQNNPLIDYTTPDLVSLVISDVGILTPSVSIMLSNRPPHCYL